MGRAPRLEIAAINSATSPASWMDSVRPEQLIGPEPRDRRCIGMDETARRSTCRGGLSGRIGAGYRGRCRHRPLAPAGYRVRLPALEPAADWANLGSIRDGHRYASTAKLRGHQHGTRGVQPIPPRKKPTAYGTPIRANRPAPKQYDAGDQDDASQGMPAAGFVFEEPIGTRQ